MFEISTQKIEREERERERKGGGEGGSREGEKEIRGERGRIDMCRYAHENGCPWDGFACEVAARGGYYDCLIYTKEEGREEGERGGERGGESRGKNTLID